MVPTSSPPELPATIVLVRVQGPTADEIPPPVPAGAEFPLSVLAAIDSCPVGLLSERSAPPWRVAELPLNVLFTIDAGAFRAMPPPPRPEFLAKVVAATV